MTTFYSNKLKINNNSKKLFDFLTNLNNFESLLPNSIEGWQSDGEKCAFNIPGIAKIELTISSKEPFKNVIYTSEGNTPLDFNISCDIDETSDFNESNVILSLNANLNPMLKMMVAKPLDNLIKIIGDKFKDVGDKL